MASAEPLEKNASVNLLRDWTDGASKQRIVDFVTKITNQSDPSYLPVEDRIAVFDNDGTLICEKPAFFQILFVHDAAVQDAAKHPEWQNDPKIKSFLDAKGDQILKFHGMESMRLGAQCWSGQTVEEFEQEATKWLETARHPKFDKPYQELIYKPVVELVDYLRANKFKVYMCSGGTTYFIRCYSKHAYGMERDEIIGSNVKLEFKDDVKSSVLTGLPDISLYNVGADKPVSIYDHIGKRPVIAVGNSNGDMGMLEFTTDTNRPSLGILIHHDDPVREYAYDKGAEAALKAVGDHHWLVVSMKDDFKSVFSFQ
ncbi:MAG TPA: HAD family hydrolase [Planktothrix sp.]